MEQKKKHTRAEIFTKEVTLSGGGDQLFVQWYVRFIKEGKCIYTSCNFPSFKMARSGARQLSRHLKGQMPLFAWLQSSFPAYALWFRKTLVYRS